MGRVKESDIGRSLHRRLDAKAEPQAEISVRGGDHDQSIGQSPSKSKKARARDGMHYVGCHIPEEMFERLRVVAFETRREKQDLMREGLDVVLKRYGG